MIIIKKLRTQNNMTQIELAKKVGITQGALSQWESGTSRPSVRMLVKLAQLFGCTVDELLQMEAKGNEPDDAA